MSTTSVFSAGSARGGTNLITKALSVGDGVHLANDPYLALLKHLRKDYLNEVLGKNFSSSDPLPDYYYKDEYAEILDTVLKADRVPRFNISSKGELIAGIKSRASVSTPLIVPYLEELEGKSYSDLVKKGLDIIRRAFNVEDAKAIGYNENWAIELFPLLNLIEPNAKFIAIYRDPRPAICSALKQKDATRMIQVLSFVRGWRKNIALILHLQQDPRFQGKLQVCKYEDFVKNPVEHLQKLSSFLGVEYTAKMLDSSLYKDGAGQSWKGNSYIHEKRPEGIYVDSIDAWERKLRPDIAEAIELITYPELRYLGYKPKYFNGVAPSAEAVQFLKDDFNTKASWNNSSKSLEQEIERELFRNFLATSKYDGFDSKEIRKNFLFEHIYRCYRGH